MLAVQDRTDLQALEDHWGPREPQGLMGQLGILDLWVTPDRLDPQGLKEMTVLWDQVDQMDRLGSKDRRVHQGLREALVARDLKEEMDTLEQQV